MDIDPNPEDTVEENDREKTMPGDVATVTETGSAITEAKDNLENADKTTVINEPDNSYTKCENEATSCTSAEDVKPNVAGTGSSTKDSHHNTGSPDPSCSICLGKMENKSFTNSCFHQFCFACLLEWSKVKPECPLCKQPFKSIVHNVRSMEDYDQYHLRLDDLNTWENPDGRRFRYRSTLTAERRRELAMGRFFTSHSMSTRSLDRLRSNGRHLLNTSDYRKHIYESGLWVRAQPATRSSRYREASPAFYVQNPACTHRLIPWLNRELNALGYSHQVSFLMELILSLIQRFNIQSPEFRELVQPYFLGNTNHFIHEFYNFARSPHDMVDYDRHVSYNDNLTQMVQDTDSDSDVIVLSPDRSSRPPWSQHALQSSPRTLSTNRDHTLVINRARDFLDRVAMYLPSTSTMSMPSTSTAASPEPGPSGLQGSSRIRSHTFPRLRSIITVPNPSVQGVKTELPVTTEDEDDDCMIIGFEEPHERHKPLDVIVLSDSDDDVIVETTVSTVSIAGPSTTVDTAQQSPRTFLETQDSESIDHEVDRLRQSDSTSRHTSRSLSPVRRKKKSKHHKRAKARHSRSTSRSKSSPSAQSSSSNKHQQNRDKRSHKKHSSKSSGRSKHPSNPQEAESSEHSHSHHKSKKKKHSHKHKRSKSKENIKTSSP